MSDDGIGASKRLQDAPAPDDPRKPESPPKLHRSSWKLVLKRTLREFSNEQVHRPGRRPHLLRDPVAVSRAARPGLAPWRARSGHLRDHRAFRDPRAGCARRHRRAAQGAARERGALPLALGARLCGGAPDHRKVKAQSTPAQKQRWLTSSRFQVWAKCGQIAPPTTKRRLMISRRSRVFKLCSEGGTRTRDTTIRFR